jgi:hypothetical protein
MASAILLVRLSSDNGAMMLFIRSLGGFCSVRLNSTLSAHEFSTNELLVVELGHTWSLSMGIHSTVTMIRMLESIECILVSLVMSFCTLPTIGNKAGADTPGYNAIVSCTDTLLMHPPLLTAMIGLAGGIGICILAIYFAALE